VCGPSEESSEETDSLLSDDDSAEEIESKWQKHSLPPAFGFTPKGVDMLVFSGKIRIKKGKKQFME